MIQLPHIAIVLACSLIGLSAILNPERADSAPPPIEFQLLFGNYTNDHTRYRFYATEREWTLKNGQLSLKNTHNERQSSSSATLTLTELDSLAKLAQVLCQQGDIARELKTNCYSKIAETTVTIKGHIKLGSKRVNVLLKSCNADSLRSDADGKRFYQLEEWLQAVLER